MGIGPPFSNPRYAPLPTTTKVLVENYLKTISIGRIYPGNIHKITFPSERFIELELADNNNSKQKGADCGCTEWYNGHDVRNAPSDKLQLYRSLNHKCPNDIPTKTQFSPLNSIKRITGARCSRPFNIFHALFPLIPQMPV